MAISRSTYDEIDEITAPGTPAAGKVRIYAKTGGNSLFCKDSAGVETDLGATGGADVLSFRNRLINGGMDVWQRNSSFAAIASAAYNADRWRFVSVGTQVCTVSRDVSVPASVNTNYSHKTEITTADAAVAAGDALVNDTFVEGYNFLPLKGQTITLSFWARSSLIGTYCVAFRNAGGTRSLVKTYTISVANTWEFKTITFVHDSTGTWDYTNGRGIIVRFTLMAGTTFQTTADTWQAGDFLATSAQVNLSATVGNTFYLTRVQLEAGSASSGFEERPFAMEVRFCQRYYETSIAYGTYAFSPSIATADLAVGGSVNDIAVGTKYVEEKRATPTVTPYAASSGTSGAVRDLTGAADVTAVSIDGGTTGFRVFKSASFTIGRFYGYHWASDAEL
jgi:hypothetical protein